MEIFIRNIRILISYLLTPQASLDTSSASCATSGQCQATPSPSTTAPNTLTSWSSCPATSQKLTGASSGSKRPGRKGLLTTCPMVQPSAVRWWPRTATRSSPAPRATPNSRSTSCLRVTWLSSVANRRSESPQGTNSIKHFYHAWWHQCDQMLD